MQSASLAQPRSCKTITLFTVDVYQKTDRCSPVEGNSQTSVPLAVIRLQLQRFVEAFNSFGVVTPRKLEVGPGLLSIHLWVEN